MRPEEVETLAGAHKPLNSPLPSDEESCPWAATVLTSDLKTPPEQESRQTGDGSLNQDGKQWEAVRFQGIFWRKRQWVLLMNRLG